MFTAYNIYNGLDVTEDHKHYTELWSIKLGNVLKNANSQLAAIHDLGYVSVTVQLEEEYPQIPHDETMRFVEKSLDFVSIAYGTWLQKLSGKFGFPDVLDNRGRLPVKLYAISLREDRPHPKRGESKYGAEWKALRYSGGFHYSPDGVESNWFSPEYDNRSFPQTLLLSFTSKIGAAGHAQPTYLRLQISDEINTFADLSTINNAMGLILHEVGHSFWMDDLYDHRKYPKPSGDYNLRHGTSNMHGSGRLTDMDHLMIRVAWVMMSRTPQTELTKALEEAMYKYRSEGFDHSRLNNYLNWACKQASGGESRCAERFTKAMERKNFRDSVQRSKNYSA